MRQVSQHATYLPHKRTIKKMVAGLGAAMLAACGQPWPSDAELVAHFEENRNLYDAAHSIAVTEFQECRIRAGEDIALEIRMHDIGKNSDDEISYEGWADPICAHTVSDDDLRRLASIAVDLEQDFLIIEQLSPHWFSFLRRKDTYDGPALYFEYAPEYIRTTFASLDDAFDHLKNSPGINGYRPLSDGWYMRLIST